MKQLLGFGGGLSAGVAIVLMAQMPAGAFTKVRDIQLVQANGEINLVLTTEGGERPEVFVVRRGNDFVADIINAQITSAQSNFQQSNPAPGVASIVVTQIDPTSVRVIVSGMSAPPEARVLQGGDQGIVIAVASGTTSAAPAAAFPQSRPQDVLVPNPEVAVSSPKGTPAQPSTTAQRAQRDVILPDGNVTSQGGPTELSSPRPAEAAPPFMPRAVAPPVGDIAVSNVNPTVSTINLNSSEIIPRLVLRDASVRDVLSLLGRVAGVNIAFTSGGLGEGQQATQPGQPGSGGPDQKISLDIENESVQDVFNYVLRLTGLEANRVGNTVFVGADLPNTARNVVVRTFRMNQVNARTAANFLVAMGGESAVSREVQVTQTNSVPIQGSTQAITSTNTTLETRIETQRIEAQDSSPLLRGLQVIVDERLNTITLVGSPSLVEVASAQLVQLDLRKRQVAVNVKILDINLTGEQAFNSSFSFGINDTFFVNDGGAASLNFGGFNPPDRGISTGGINARPIIENRTNDGQELSEEDPFFDRDGIETIPLTAPGEGGLGLRPIPPITDRPGRPGIREYNPFTRNDDGSIEVGDVTYETFPFFQYPRRFLSTLQAQVVSGNAKILTDPTLIVQEGESARVALVENIVRSIDVERTVTAGALTEDRTVNFGDVGLTLEVNVERVDDNGFVTFTMTPTVSAIRGDRLVTDDQGGFATETLVRTLNSGRVRLRDGQTLIVSGIIQDSDRVTVSKIPILGDLPIIGALFRSTNRENERAEVIVLVTPNVLDDSDRAPYGYEYNVSPDAQELLQQRGR
ncbi:MAG: AMIN domain-containing protein [Microcoleaceae cyanobacterium]